MCGVELSIKLENPAKASLLFGPMDRNLKMIRDALGVQVFAREGQVKLTGSAKSVSAPRPCWKPSSAGSVATARVSVEDIAQAISTAAGDETKQASEVLDVYVSGQLVRPRRPASGGTSRRCERTTWSSASGPAGTGKTYLAVAVAVHMLKHHQAKRLILVRPAVEAGEKLGFLPGDMQAKVNPYLRPLFDALHDMMDFEQIRRFMANDLIEVIPLAFMRGRTLNDSVIILDEAQNTTAGQMLMFLTRMGHGSKMIVTGDDSQIDLPADVSQRPARRPPPAARASRASRSSAWKRATSSATGWCRTSLKPMVPATARRRTAISRDRSRSPKPPRPRPKRTPKPAATELSHCMQGTLHTAAQLTTPKCR